MVEYPKKRVEVLGSNMAYVDVGIGPSVLFLHGNPTSSFLWRDIIRHVSSHARCLAADLIGFGDSDQPSISYRVKDHARYLEEFIQVLDVQEVVLVLHDWGSALGLDWARRHPDQVRGLALMEFIWPTPTWLDLDPRSSEILQSFRDPEQGRRLVIDENRFIEQVLPGNVIGGLSAQVMEVYRRPFLDPSHREPVYRFPNELPIAGQPVDVYAMASAYHEWLLETAVPKLFFWAEPGGLISPKRAVWYTEHLKACRSVALGPGGHYLQENHSDTIGREMVRWLQTLG